VAAEKARAWRSLALATAYIGFVFFVETEEHHIKPSANQTENSADYSSGYGTLVDVAPHEIADSAKSKKIKIRTNLPALRDLAMATLA
jgi:hypothetical protein